MSLQPAWDPNTTTTPRTIAGAAIVVGFFFKKKKNSKFREVVVWWVPIALVPDSSTFTFQVTPISLPFCYLKH